MLKHMESSFDGAINTVNKELSSARVECATFLRKRDEERSKAGGFGERPRRVSESRV